MTHVPFLGVLYRAELILSTVLVIVLIVIGFTKKDMILSETGINRLKERWQRFRALFYTAVLGMIFFMILIAIEFIEVEQGLEFHSLYPDLTEVIRFFLVLTLLVVNLLNLNLVMSLIGGEDGHN